MLHKVPEIDLWGSFTCKPGVPKGPNNRHKPMFISRMPLELRPHLHPQDDLLCTGGAGSSKTATACVCVIDTCLRFPGTKAYVGGIDMQLLKRNVVDVYKDILSYNGVDWGHPVVLKRWAENSPTIRLFTGHGKPPSQINFVNLTMFLKNRGASAGIIQVDEPSLLPDAGSVDEFIKRLRDRHNPIRQLIMCTNPEETKGWLRKRYQLHLYESEDFDTHPKVIGPKCTCYVCTMCLLEHKKEFAWDENNNCPNCGIPREFYYAPKLDGSIVKVYCPGGQQYTRVIRSKSYDNPHLTAEYLQGMRDKLDPIRYLIYVEGRLDIEVRGEYAYSSYSTRENLLEKNWPIDYSKDFIWGLDWNLHPQCSSISQIEDLSQLKEYLSIDVKIPPDNKGLVIKDEIILWGPTPEQPIGGASPEDVAHEFVRRFKDDYQGTTIHIAGDPNGFKGVTTRELTKYDIIISILEEEGFKVNLIADDTPMPKKERVDNVNTMFKNANLERRLFVNPKAEHVAKSFEELRWDDSGKNLDEKPDKAAKKNPNKYEIFLMTHPTDGIGYAIFKLFNILTDNKPVQFAQFQSGTLIEVNEEGRVIRKDPEEEKKKQDKQIIEVPPVSFRSMLRQNGIKI